MPMIHVEMFAGRTAEQKREFAETVTRETCRILKCEPGDVDIIFAEIARQDWATAGRLHSDPK